MTNHSQLKEADKNYFKLSQKQISESIQIRTTFFSLSTATGNQQV